MAFFVIGTKMDIYGSSFKYRYRDVSIVTATNNCIDFSSSEIYFQHSKEEKH